MNLIVLDIDDTLTKSESQHQLSYVNTMKHFGINNINENWETYKHLTDSYILKINYESNFGKPFPNEMIPEFESEMMRAISKLPPAKEVKGAKDFIGKTLADKHWGICFATGSFLEPAKLKLKQAEIQANEKLLVGSNDYLSREDIVLNAIQKAKQFYNVASFKQIISVGDGMWDYKTAKNLGVHFIGIGEKNRKKFRLNNVALCINHWAGLDINLALNELVKTE